MEKVSKVCTKCKIEKSLEDFSKRKEGILGRRSDCKVCFYNMWKNGVGKSEKRKKWAKSYLKTYNLENFERLKKQKKEYIKNYPKEKLRETYKLYMSKEENKIKLRHKAREVKYGLSKEAYETMLIEQNFKCKICETHQSELKKILCVDHCHITGKVRGLLCNKCNVGLGCFKDNILLLNNSIKYLENG